jgi:hypothetical protein
MKHRFQFAEKCELPERERKASQLIERGVHQLLNYKNNADVKFVQMEV